jgi:hypothetical protein
MESITCSGVESVLLIIYVIIYSHMLVLYGHETWSLILKEEHIEVFENNDISIVLYLR